MTKKTVGADFKSLKKPNLSARMMLKPQKSSEWGSMALVGDTSRITDTSIFILFNSSSSYF